MITKVTSASDLPTDGEFIRFKLKDDDRYFNGQVPAGEDYVLEGMPIKSGNVIDWKQIEEFEVLVTTGFGNE